MITGCFLQRYYRMILQHWPETGIIQITLLRYCDTAIMIIWLNECCGRRIAVLCDRAWGVEFVYRNQQFSRDCFSNLRSVYQWFKRCIKYVFVNHYPEKVACEPATGRPEAPARVLTCSSNVDESVNDTYRNLFSILSAYSSGWLSSGYARLVKTKVNKRYPWPVYSR